jgi:hypothetical protein
MRDAFSLSERTGFMHRIQNDIARGRAVERNRNVIRNRSRVAQQQSGAYSAAFIGCSPLLPFAIAVPSPVSLMVSGRGIATVL